MKKPFLIFIAIMGILITATLAVIQSPWFARTLKNVIASRLPTDLGIEGDFSDLAIQFFPPGLSVRNPHVTLAEKNVAKLPAGSSLSAEELKLVFRPFQMFSGTIRVHEVVVVNGKLKLLLRQSDFEKKPQKKSVTSSLKFDELLQVHAEAIALKNTDCEIQVVDSSAYYRWTAESLRVAQWSGKEGLGFELSADMHDIAATITKSLQLPDKIDRLHIAAHLNSTGLQFGSIVLKGEGVEFESSGSITGNIISGKGLQLDASLNARADAGRLVDAITSASQKKPSQKKPATKKATGEEVAPESRPRVAGSMEFVGKIRGSVDRFADSMRAEGALVIRDGAYGPWSADLVRAEGSWAASPSGGEIAVSKVIAQSKEVAKLGGHQPGWGGKVEIGAFKYVIGSSGSAPITVPLTLDRAHIHWLAAGALKDVYPLNFRASGGIKATYDPGRAGKPWGARVELGGLELAEFALDNQKVAQNKPLRYVLKIPKPLKLEGAAEIDASGFKPSGPNGLTVSLNKSKFQAQGKLDFKTGWDLHASGNVDLSDIGELAQNEIRGVGLLSVHVHGPASRTLIDFDADVKDAMYLNLQLGSLLGRITWDDDPNQLLFTNCELKKGQSVYLANGKFDLGKTDTADLSVTIPKGDIQDFIQVFGFLTKKLWWFPKTLAGSTTGAIHVGGGLRTELLQIAAVIQGTDWQYMGEKFKTVSLRGGYDREKYYVSELAALKRTGEITARISFDADRRFDWEVNTREMKIGDFDLLAKLDVPIRGKFGVRSIGKGKEGALESQTLISLSEVAVRGVGMPPSQLSLKTSGGAVHCVGTALGGQGTLDVRYDFNHSNLSSIRAEMKRLDFSPLLLLLNPKTSQDPLLEGNISGLVNLSFRSGEIERGTGRFELSDYVLAKTGARFKLVHPIAFGVNDGSFEIKDLSVSGYSGKATLWLQGRKGQIEGSVLGDLDASILEFLTSAIAKANGTARLDFAFGGEIKAPTVFGRASFENSTVKVASLESPFENVSGSFQIKQNVLTAQNIEADLASGRVSAEGKILLFADRFPTIALKGLISGSKLKFYPFQYAKVHGGLQVAGEEPPYLVSGQVTVDSALSREKVFNQKQGESLKAVKFNAPATRQTDRDYPKFTLKVRAIADQGVFVQNDLFDAELKGDVTIVNTLEAPRILGTAEIIRGKMNFKDHSFHIQSANVNFDSPTVINPSFNLSSSTDVNGVKVSLFAQGRLDKMKVELSSNPVMPESEILSLLTIGMTTSERGVLSAKDRTLVERGEAASLILNSLDFNREVQNKTGLAIQLEESVDNSTGTSLFQKTADNQSAAATRIVIKKKIGKQLDLSFGSTVGLGAATQKEVNAELQLTPGMSVMGVWGSDESVGLQQTYQYGMDLKVQKRFK